MNIVINSEEGTEYNIIAKVTHTETKEPLLFINKDEKYYLVRDKKSFSDSNLVNIVVTCTRIVDGDFVTHFKRELNPVDLNYCYKVERIGVALDDQIFTVYRAMYGDKLWFARPICMFLGYVDYEKYPDIKQRYRLEVIAKDTMLHNIMAVEG